MSKTKQIEPTQSAEIVPLAAKTDSDAVISLIDKFMLNPDVQVEKLEQLFELHRRVKEEGNRTVFASALASAQAQMQPVCKDADNPATRSRYASYDALDRAIRPIYTRHGFAISFNTATSTLENHVEVIAYLTHSSGYERTYRIDLPCDGKGARGNDVMTKTHALGSAVTYGKRYLLSSIFNVATTDRQFSRDDDGNAAGGSDVLITSEELIDLQALIDKGVTDQAAFKKYLTQTYKIDELPELTSLQAKKLRDALNDKIAKKKKEVAHA